MDTQKNGHIMPRLNRDDITACTARTYNKRLSVIVAWAQALRSSLLRFLGKFEFSQDCASIPNKTASLVQSANNFQPVRMTCNGLFWVNVAIEVEQTVPTQVPNKRPHRADSTDYNEPCQSRFLHKNVSTILSACMTCSRSQLCLTSTPLLIKRHQVLRPFIWISSRVYRAVRHFRSIAIISFGIEAGVQSQFCRHRYFRRVYWRLLTWPHREPCTSSLSLQDNLHRVWIRDQAFGVEDRRHLWQDSNQSANFQLCRHWIEDSDLHTTERDQSRFWQATRRPCCL